MTFSYATRRKLAVLTVCAGLPLYVVLAVTAITAFERPPLVLEVFLYILMGIGWIFPTRWIFMGVGKADPQANALADEISPSTKS